MSVRMTGLFILLMKIIKSDLDQDGYSPFILSQIMWWAWKKIGYMIAMLDDHDRNPSPERPSLFDFRYSRSIIRQAL